MEDNGAEVGSAAPSPKGRDSEAMPERGLEAKEVTWDAPMDVRDDASEATKQDLQSDEAAGDQAEGGHGDPPSQAEPDSEIPAGIEAEAPGVVEPKELAQEAIEPQTKEEPAQQEMEEPQIDPAVTNSEAKIDPPLDDIKPEAEKDAVPIEPEPVTDVTPDTSPDEIKPDADICLDEVQSSKESAAPGKESVCEATPIANESGIDESPVEMEAKADPPSGDLAPVINEVPVTDFPSAEIESEVSEPLVEAKSDADASPYELDTINARDEVPSAAEQETDGAPAESKLKVEEAQIEELETAGLVYTKPETEEAPTIDADAAPIELETINAPDEVPVQAEREMDGAEVKEAQVEELETAGPVDTKPETEEAPTMARELETHAAPTNVDAEVVPEKEIAVDAQPEMGAAPADTAAETIYVRQDIDTSPDGIPPDVDASVDEVPPEADTSPDKIPLEAAVTNYDNTSNETDLDENAEPVEAEQKDVSQAEIQAPPVLEPEVKTLIEEVPEVISEGAEIPAETDTNLELPQKAETEPKPQDVIEDTSLWPLQEMESEAKVAAVDEAKPEDEVCVETKAEESGPVQSDTDIQEPVEDVKAVPHIEPEPQVETSRGIELDAEAVDAEPELATEAPVDLEPDEIAQSGKQDLVQIEPDQSGDQQLQKQEVEEDVSELTTSIPEVNQSLESQPLVVDASDVREIENEPSAISASDELNLVEDSTSSVSSSDSSDNSEAEQTVIKPEPEKVDDIPPSATLLGEEFEGTFEGVSDNQDSAANIEQAKGVAGDIEERVADELPDESKEDNNRQERAVDSGHDEGEGVSSSAGIEGETEKASEQELAIELPLATVGESAKEDISNQERTIDVGHDGDGAVPGSAENSSEVEVQCEQDSGVGLPPADVSSVEESTKEGPPPCDPEQVLEQQDTIDKEDPSMRLGAAGDEPPTVESEQNPMASIPVESDTFSDAPVSQDGAVTSATDEKVASENEFHLESAGGEPEKDIGEEEAASSTVAEAGSVLNDFDERASCEQDLHVDFPSIDQDTDTSDSKESDGNLSTEAPEYVLTGLTEKSDFESAEAAIPAEAVHSALLEEASSNEHSPSLLQPEQVVRDSGQDKICLPTEEVLEDKELRIDDEEKAMVEDDKLAASLTLGSALPNFVGDELISKAFTYLENGQQSNPKGLGKEQREESSVQSEANDTDKSEIHAMETRELKEEAEHKPEGIDSNIDVDRATVKSHSPTLEERDIKDVQAFRQETTKEASLPVVVPTQDRGLEHVNVKSTERPSRGGTLEGRRKMLGCCGMFDLLLGKN